MNSIEKTFDDYAASYRETFDDVFLARYQREKIHSAILPYLKKAHTILDIGCGPGSDFAFYTRLPAKITAIDISGEMVQLARKKAKESGLDAGISHTSLEGFCPASSFDAVIMNFGVMNAIEKVDETLQKIKGMLKKDGVFIVVVMPPFHLFSFLSSFVTLNLTQALTRVMKKAVLRNGIKIMYYTKNDLLGHFTLIRKIHLCSILPTPDQYRRWLAARIWVRIFIRLDAKIGQHIPDFLGGDHICYILRA